MKNLFLLLLVASSGATIEAKSVDLLKAPKLRQSFQPKQVKDVQILSRAELKLLAVHRVFLADLELTGQSINHFEWDYIQKPNGLILQIKTQPVKQSLKEGIILRKVN